MPGCRRCDSVSRRCPGGTARCWCAAFVAEPILAALRQAGIAVQLVTDREVETAKEVLATIAWLRLAMSRRIGQPGQN